MKLKRFIPAVSAVVLVFSSCVTMADYNYKNINAAITDNRYSDVYAELENPEGKLYTANDEVLKNLDKGLISHYAGEYVRSNEELSCAEKLIEENKAKSISQAISSTLVNDTVIDYAGDPYEDIYTNIFMSLNYLHQGLYDDSMVEVRRFDNKLKEIMGGLQKQIEKQKRELKENDQSVPAVNLKFHNSALARYLSMILYMRDGDQSNAEVDYKMMKDCFRLQPEIYNFDFPEETESELSVKKSDARLNLLAFSGLCPVKHEEKIELFCLNGLYKVALPAMDLRDSQIAGVTAACENIETGEINNINFSHIESIENIAAATWQQKYAWIVGKTLIRMVAKLAPSIALDIAAKKTDNSLFSLIGMFTKVSAFVSERADVRCSRYFPAEAFGSGITLAPGKYNVSVSFLSSSGRVVETFVYNDIEVKTGKMNFVESYCLK